MQDVTRSNFGNRYTIINKIGQGGIGEIYQAHDRIDNKTIAIKTINTRYQTTDELKLRFKKEFSLMSKFKHPNTVEVYEYGLTDDCKPFITMEYIKGKNLSQIDNLSIQQIIDMLIQISLALSYIHSRSYIHRDLKPQNIIHQEKNSIKLLDYGLMNQIGTSDNGSISGTVNYMAPEVITGGLIDQRTDLYSLGIIAYELLTGKPVFSGETKKVIYNQLHTQLPPLRESAPGTPSYIDKIIMRLTRKEKNARYRDTTDLLKDLKNYASHSGMIGSSTGLKAYLYSSDLIGREQETDAFHSFLKKGKEGRHKSFLIGASAGVGKTRLIKEFKTVAQLQDFTAIHICGESIRNHNYGWVRSLLSKILPLIETNLDKDYISNLAHFNSRLRKYANKTDDISENNIAAEIRYWLSIISAEKALAIFTDDLHWIDLNSLRVINETIRLTNKYPNPIVFVSSFRNNEINRQSPIWHTIDNNLSRYVELDPLTPDDTKVLVANLLRPFELSHQFLEMVYRTSGGNVFDIIEFLRFLIDEKYLTKAGNKWVLHTDLSQINLPEQQERRLQKRIENLEQNEFIAASAASVLDQNVNLSTWLEVAGLAEADLFSAIEGLTQNQIIIKINQEYQFSHLTLKETVYKNTSQAEIKKYHLRAAQKLVRGDDYENQYSKIARHFVQAGALEEGISYSIKAARQAELNRAEHIAFNHYKDAVKLLQKNKEYPEREKTLYRIYEKAAHFNSAVWVDARTCFNWLRTAIDYYEEVKNRDKIFELSMAYIAASTVKGNYKRSRTTIQNLINRIEIREGSLEWAMLFGAGVCLVDWYQGLHRDCLRHAQKSIRILESKPDNLNNETYPAYAWALFWEQKALAYTGRPIKMDRIQKIRELTDQGKSDLTIYWHTLTAVGARAAFTGRYKDLLQWKEVAAELSRIMGKIYWFECWISHSFLYGALAHGELTRIKPHINRVAESPDPYQRRLSYLFKGRYELIKGNYIKAIENLELFIRLEKSKKDNSFPEGLVYLAKTYLAKNNRIKSRSLIEQGLKIVTAGQFENPFYEMQFLRLRGELRLQADQFEQSKNDLNRALELAQEQNNPIQQGHAYLAIGDLYKTKNDKEAALENYEYARQAFELINNKYQQTKAEKLANQIKVQQMKGTSKRANIDLDMRTTEIGGMNAITIYDQKLDLNPNNSEEQGGNNNYTRQETDE